MTTNLVEVPCALCGTPAPTMPWFDTDHRRHLVRCGQHTPQSPEPEPPGLADVWRARAAEFAHETVDRIGDALCRRAISATLSHWPDPPTRALLLLGPTGIGKTSAAYSLLNGLVLDGHLHPNDVLASTETDLLAPLTNLSKFADRRDLAPILRGKRVLLLDDLGYSRYASNEDRVSLIQHLLETVKKQRIFLLVTTNAPSVSALQRAIGEAPFSRLWQMVGEGYLSPGQVDHRTARDYGVHTTNST